MRGDAFVDQQKRKLIKEVLQYKEDVLDFYLPDELSDDFRLFILDKVNSCFRGLPSAGESVNEIYLDRLQAAIDRLESLE